VMGLMMFLVAWTRHKTITRVPRTRHAGTCKRAPWRCRSSDMRDGQLGNRRRRTPRGRGASLCAVWNIVGISLELEKKRNMEVKKNFGEN
jgi:hypothetical protein